MQTDERRKFAIGERVTKTKGSSWLGRVVGFYSTDLTPIGYAVESEREPGSVQIYPEAALTAALSDEQTQAGVKPGPVAWMHPTAHWASTKRENVRAHCRNNGPQPIPLYAAPVRSAIVPAQDEADAIQKIDGVIRKLHSLHRAFDMQGANSTTMLRAVNTLSTLRSSLSPRTVSTSEEQGEGSAIISKGISDV